MKTIRTFIHNETVMGFCGYCVYCGLTPEDSVEINALEHIKCGLAPVCDSCCKEGIWAPYDVVFISVCQAESETNPTVTVNNIDKLPENFNKVEISVWERSFETGDWRYKTSYSHELRRNQDQFVNEYTFKVDCAIFPGERLKNNDYKISVTGYDNDTWMELSSYEFKVNYRGDFPLPRPVDMIVYRVVGGGKFGGYGSDCWLEVGHKFEDAAVFCTPHAHCVTEMLEACNYWAQSNKVPNCAKVAVIRASQVRDYHKSEKFGDSRYTDEDEMILIDGVVLDVVDGL